MSITLHPILADEDTPMVPRNEPNRCRWCFCAVGVLVILGIFGGTGVLLFSNWCNDSETTFQYCICRQYSAKTPDLHTCYRTFNPDHTVMNCLMDTGYYTCNISTDNCIRDRYNKGKGWGNCVYVQSDIIRRKIATCDTFIWGREICSTKNQTCCWYST
jgi:hypothetical protein